MLFNSFPFLFAFLPVTLLVFYTVALVSRRGAQVALIALSLGFYAWWRPLNLWLLVGSILFNYSVGLRIQRDWQVGRPRAVRFWLVLGVTADLALLGYFKYANFFADNLSVLTGRDLTLARIALPLAISFFTFQKIAYLVDSARGEAKRTDFIEFTLFATFFPPLIAGPIVHYSEIIPQLRGALFGRLLGRNILVGLAIFSIGLFKKSVLADTLGTYVDPLYALAASGHRLDFATSWLSGSAYMLQLYFDFSGYSDMAIGLARLFGVLLPLNFHSPLRAPSVLDYWRRWHMTLQRFIVSYLFQPLALPLNRFAAQRGLRGWPAFGVGVALPAFISFVLIGFWHGAGWTFIWFGVIHACYVCINEAWRQLRKDRNRALRKKGQLPREPSGLTLAGYHALTVLCVVFAEALFRADDMTTGLNIWRGMLGLQGLTVSPEFAPFYATGFALMLAASIGIVALLPNTQQIMKDFRPAVNWRLWKGIAPAWLGWRWQPRLGGLAFIGLLLFFGVEFIQRGQAVFLYFNF